MMSVNKNKYRKTKPENHQPRSEAFLPLPSLKGDRAQARAQARAQTLHRFGVNCRQREVGGRKDILKAEDREEAPGKGEILPTACTEPPPSVKIITAMG